MASKKFSDDYKYINAKLTGEHPAAFAAWYKSKEGLFQKSLDEMHADNYKFSHSWDAKNQCFIGSCTFKGDKGDNVNRCLTARSDNWLETYAMLAYKHTVMFEGGVWEEAAGVSDWG